MGIFVYGASGHAKVVLDILRKNKCDIAGFFDDNKSLWGDHFLGHKIWSIEDLPIESMKGSSPKHCEIFLAIGDNVTRKRIAKKVSDKQYCYLYGSSIEHPSAQVDNLIFGKGTISMANVVVNIGSKIGSQVILNTGCTVDHDCIIEDYVHLSPGVHLAGNVHVGEGAHLGVGVNVIPGIKIGAWSTIGAGAAVVDHIPPYSTAVGVPARVIKTHESNKE